MSIRCTITRRPIAATTKRTSSLEPTTCGSCPSPIRRASRRSGGSSRRPPEPATTLLAALGLGAVTWRARRTRRNRQARAEIAFHDFPRPAGERCAHPWRSASACPTRGRRQPQRT
ncbi:MAG: PEP-CTERM sorting domain-containing protein [Armatimonadetes bacterium]|nr:PEP-CTERM sorting domain-containing protein [Armatimonadota bacterium]